MDQELRETHHSWKMAQCLCIPIEGKNKRVRNLKFSQAYIKKRRFESKIQKMNKLLFQQINTNFNVNVFGDKAPSTDSE